jgi:hypothetical protein
MRYLSMTRPEREALWTALTSMPRFLRERFEALSPQEAVMAGPDGGFSPVEQCWHLADLEREGFGERIRRLLAETDPHLPDFDGARLARERAYRDRSLPEGLRLFEVARTANLATLRSLDAAQWSRQGTQEGVGAVALCDLPHMMAEHDEAHRAEIAAWQPRA